MTKSQRTKSEITFKITENELKIEELKEVLQ
jgi:hypothetical protein